MDQVPLLIVIGVDENWDTKGSHGHVCFYHPGAGSDTIFCSVKLCLYQHGIQPNITVIIWVTGKGIVDFDKEAYRYDVLLF